MKKLILAFIALLMLPLSMGAQRKTDRLDRGLIGVPANGGGIFLSWRVQADEYYDVTYNVYKNGGELATGLTASNYRDVSGQASDRYQVAAVKRAIEGEKCAEVTPWAEQYFEFPVSSVQARSGVTVWTPGGANNMADYVINDISLGDVDGDGKIDFIVKRKNQTDQNELFPESNKQMFCQIECYASSISYGRLWWIDCGPNICYGADEQWDAVAFDWNQDGKCEVLYRGGANTIIHHADGSTETIGNVNENIRGGITHYANMTFSNAGEEWLMYIDGSTGKTFDVISYPIPRGNVGDWGDTYGHRSSKYFMGAPYLDGQKPYIFLGRGIYTKINACAFEVVNNKLRKVGNTWQSYNNEGWHGQGNHNFAIADVDEDGADEIVYGSMVLDFHTGDRNIHGMASTNLGHGDAAHTGDLDPFRKGLETFACNEDAPSNNFRNAATCEIYARHGGDGDDGRAMAGNFTNEYPGGIAASTASGVLPLSFVQPSPLSPTYIAGMVNDWNGQTPYPMALNFRIYWDGDLLSETLNGPGSNESYLYVDKLGRRIFDTNKPQWSTACINGTKKNPCASGDILGDWREEIVMRTSDNTKIRVYTTNIETTHRMQSLWYDHQYRQAMVWQTEGYNQPPHPSFFVGELEGFTAAPPAYTWENRETDYSGEIRGSLIGNKDVLLMTYGDENIRTFRLLKGAAPSTIFFNSRTTVEGGDEVTYKETKRKFDRIYITTDDNSYGFSSNTNLCKQGSSALHLPYSTHTHTGKTDVWAGALVCNGSITNSPVWANRHTELFLGCALAGYVSSYKSIEMEYGSALYITDHSKNVQGTNAPSTAALTGNGYGHMSVTETLFLKEGSRIVYDLNGGSNASGDKVNIGTLKTRKQNWQYGPKYLQPIMQFNASGKLANGDYQLGTLANIAAGSSIEDIIIEIPNGHNGKVAQIVAEKNNEGTAYTRYYLHIGDTRVLDTSGDVIAHPANSEVVGLEENTSTTGSAYSSETAYNLTSGQSCHIEYINYNGKTQDGSKTGNTKNGVFVVSNADGSNDLNKIFTDEDLAKMDGARVSVDAYFENGTLTYYAVITTLDGEVITKTQNVNELPSDVKVRMTVNESHIAIDKDKTYKPESGYTAVVEQHFEDDYSMDGWRIANGGRLQGIQQEANGAGNHVLYLKSTLEANNNGTNATYTIPASDAYSQSNDYVFKFTFAHTSTSPGSQTSSIVLKDDKGNDMVRFEADAAATEGRIMIGGENKGAYSVKAGTYFTTEQVPANFHNIVVTANKNGTYMTLDGGGQIKISDDIIKANQLIYNTARYAAQLMVDDISLEVASSTTDLSENAYPVMKAGKYATVNVTRSTLKPGYNAVSVPIFTTAQELAGDKATAYTIASITDKGSNNYQLNLQEVATIEPNTPYVLYVNGDEPVLMSNLSGKMIYTAAETSKTIDGSWTFKANYTPAHTPEGNAYTLNGDIAAATTVNGINAYLAGPADANISVKRPASGIAGKTFYLYNKESGRFLSRGSSWGTRAIADEFGVPVTMEQNGANFYLKFVDNNGYIGNDNHNWVYTDKSTDKRFSYDIEEVEGTQGVYMLHDIGINNANNRLYVYTKEDADKYCVATNAIIGDNCANEGYAQWQFLTAEERNTLVAERQQAEILATVKEGLLDVTSLEEISKYTVAVDVTSSVTNAELRTNVDGWNKTSAITNTGDARYISTTSSDNVTEVYERVGNLSQTVSGLPKGLYRVSISAFNRQGTSANCITFAEYDMSTAYLQANNHKVAIMPWDKQRTDDTTPNGRGGANTSFTAGNYTNTLYTTVGDDGNLTITIAQPTYLSAEWLIFRDIKVERLEPIVFLYNPETKKFLGRGGAYGTQGIADDFGVPVRLEAITGSNVKLKSIDHDYYYGLTPDLYGDAKTAGEYTIAKDVDKYTIHCTNGFVYVNNDKVSDNGVSGNTAKWLFLSAPQRNARIAEFHNEVAKSVADATNIPATTYDELKTVAEQYGHEDATSLLGGNVLVGNYEGWTGSHYSTNLTGNAGLSDADKPFKVNYSNNAMETYNRTTKITKTLTNPGAGLYKVTVYGYFRQGTKDVSNSADYLLSSAYLDVNGKKVQWADYNSGNKPDFAGAAASFDAGNYENTVFAYVNAGEDMTITLAQPGWTKNGWFTFYKASITKYDPTEMTGFIKNAGCDDGVEGWEGTDATMNENGAEFFDKTFDMNQTITGLPNGWYTVGVQGFYRNGKTGGKASKTLIFANEASTYLRSLESQTAQECGLASGKLPDTMGEAKTVFDKGLYKNSIKVYVYDGTLTVGLKKETATGSDWTMFDNFTLHYDGETNLDNDRTQYIKDPSFETADANTYWNYAKIAQENVDAQAKENSNSYTMSNNDGNYIFSTWAPEADMFTLSQQMTGLPAGVYTLSAVLASDQNNTINIDLNDEYKSEDFTMTGAKGDGQQAEIAQIVVREDGDTISMKVSSPTWFKADNFRLTYTGPATAEVIMTDAKEQLQKQIATANTEKAMYPTGGKMFDFDAASPALTDITGKTGTAQGVHDSSSDLDDIDEQTAIMKEANKQFAANKSGIKYNGPAAEKRYLVKLNGTPLTRLEEDGLWFPTFKKAEVDVNYIQAFMLEPDPVQPLSYNLAFINAAGVKCYLGNNGDDLYGVAITSEQSQAFSFTVERSDNYSTSDVIYLRNPKLGNNYLSMTNNEHKALRTGLVGDGKPDFTITEASKATPTYKVGKTAGWGTFIAPFAVDVPSGSEAYTVTGIEDGELALARVESTIPANTPVILKHGGEEYDDISLTVSDFGTASKDDYQKAYLVGRYSNANLPITDENTKYYILQRQGEETAFFNINKDRAATPYRCYLAIPKADPEAMKNARISFPTEVETEVNGVNFEELPTGEIYTTSGLRVNTLQRGVNIMKLNDGRTVKIMKK